MYLYIFSILRENLIIHLISINYMDRLSNIISFTIEVTLEIIYI